MNQVLLVALGGAVGSIARYGVSLAAARYFSAGFPWGTLIVNVAGSLLIGLLAGRVGPSDENMRLLLGVGALGGFTTFSAFSLETIRLAQNSTGLAALYVAASLTLGLAACWLGLSLGRS